MYVCVREPAWMLCQLKPGFLCISCMYTSVLTQWKAQIRHTHNTPARQPHDTSKASNQAFCTCCKPTLAATHPETHEDQQYKDHAKHTQRPSKPAQTWHNRERKPGTHVYSESLPGRQGAIGSEDGGDGLQECEAGRPKREHASRDVLQGSRNDEKLLEM